MHFIFLVLHAPRHPTEIVPRFSVWTATERFGIVFVVNRLHNYGNDQWHQFIKHTMMPTGRDDDDDEDEKGTNNERNALTWHWFRISLYNLTLSISISPLLVPLFAHSVVPLHAMRSENWLQINNNSIYCYFIRFIHLPLTWRGTWRLANMEWYTISYSCWETAINNCVHSMCRLCGMVCVPPQKAITHNTTSRRTIVSNAANKRISHSHSHRPPGRNRIRTLRGEHGVWIIFRSNHLSK